VGAPPRLCVIMPAYQAAAYIGEAIASILAQSHAQFELLVVDDGSTDGTADIVAATDDPRIRLVRLEHNVGVSAARSLGLTMTTSEYVAWQDSDDISAPRRLERQMAFLDEHRDVVIVGGFLRFFGRGSGSVRRYAPDDETLRARIFRYSPVAQPAAMVRRSAVEAVGGYHTEHEVAADLDMAFRLGAVGTFANLQEVVLDYRESDASLTIRRLRAMELTTLRLRWRHARDPAYSLHIGDVAFNLAQAASMLTMSPLRRTAVFNRIRNS
jgi:glycosyltransferase involved in cell wall biosynthesis